MNYSQWAAKHESEMSGKLHEQKSAQPMKAFVNPVDDKKAVKGFNQEQTRMMISDFIQVGSVEDGLESKPRDKKFSGYCESLEKRTGSKPKKWKRRHIRDGSDVRCE